MIRVNQIKMEEVFDAIFPIGSDYTNFSDNTNPATLFGFGTWELAAVGRVEVGIDIGDASFDTVGETGGEKAHTLLSAEMPSHTHTQNSHNHTQNSHTHWTDGHAHVIRYKTFSGLSAGGSMPIGRTVISGDSYTGTDAAATWTSMNLYGNTATNQATTATNQNTGSNESHSNLQPYIVAYIWKRTA